ncbi:MAG: hypothetical protein M1834_007168 [Cirrosporium novae-zelandiae]|nr:MAG: hypothetical protein M1834_007168 [Cirrosporium novae-zelandiae]
MSTCLQLVLLQPDGSPIQEPILGIGRTGVIVQHSGTALKLPLKYRTAGLSKPSIRYWNNQTEISHESLRREKEIYQRLDQCYGIVPCLDLSNVGIRMALMINGNLYNYLTKHQPAKTIQLTWFREMARTLVYIHDLCVIVADIATRNFLLAADLSVKFSDFSESSILSLGTNMETVEDTGYSIYTDIGQLGAVMYEVITRQPCEFDLFKDRPPGPATAAWPRRETLPSTQNIWLGSVIEKCWTKKAFQNAHELLEMLDSIVLE